MKDRNTTPVRGRIDGAVQISNGRIGDLATVASQNMKAPKWRMETIKRMYS
jgi:hypothetical protein